METESCIGTLVLPFELDTYSSVATDQTLHVMHARLCACPWPRSHNFALQDLHFRGRPQRPPHLFILFIYFLLLFYFHTRGTL